MYTIKDNLENTIVIKNSKFICCLYKVYDIEKVNYYLKEIRNIYKDATHYCYAYIIDNYKKFSDDNEPSGTAGSPIIQVLEKNNLNYILCIVIRYFGGIKLGAGGLVRAYSKSVVECLNKSEKLNLIKGKNISIVFNYEDTKDIDNILKNSLIIDKVFSDKVLYKVNVEENIINKLENKCKIIINKDIYIEK